MKKNYPPPFAVTKLSVSTEKILWLMRKSLVLFALLMNIAAFAFSQNVVTIKAQQEQIATVLKEITRQSGVDFFYSSQVLDDTKTISIRLSDVTVEEALQHVLGTEYQAQRVDEDLFMIKLKEKELVPQDERVKGRITDNLGEPLIGATIWRKGTSGGAVTDQNGYFTLMANAGDTLQISSLGYLNQEVVVSNQKEIIVKLKEDVKSLNEVTVVSTGYEEIEVERVTGAFVTMGSEELKKIPVSNVIHRLEGQVPGLQLDIRESDNTFVYNTLIGDAAGETSYTFRIRGRSTFDQDGRNDMPLVVLDGTPTELDIRTLNPDDIESITFLKDAAAAAIYGVRAANGVMVVNTKRGKGRMQINFSYNNTFAEAPSLSDLPLMNAEQVLDLEQELVDNYYAIDPTAATYYLASPISQGMEIMFQEQRGEITTAEKEAMLAELGQRNSYGQIEKYLLRSSSSENYNLSIGGGDELYNFYVGGSYAKEKTQTVGDDGQRITLTANQGFKLFDYAMLNTSLKGSLFKFNQNGLGLSPLSSSLTTFLPYDQIVDDQGNSVKYYQNYYSGQIKPYEDQGYLPWTYDYIQELENSNKTIQEQNLSANVSLTVPLGIQGLDFKSTYSVERSYSSNKNLYNEETYYTRNLINSGTTVDPYSGALSYAIPKGAFYQVNNYVNTNNTSRFQLNLNRTFFTKHQVSAIAGIEFRQMKAESNSSNLYGYNEATQYATNPAASTYVDFQGWYSYLPDYNSISSNRRRFLSYYGDAAYTFNSKYTLSGSVRLDDYNNFGVDKKYRRQPLWSTGFKWNLSKEPFIESITAIDNLGLRASYGYNGNVSLTTYPFTNIGLADMDYFTSLPYAFIVSAANPALRWEKTGVLNFGLDFAVFNSRLRGTVEYYTKNSRDLIVDFPVSEFYGVPGSVLTQNAAAIDAKGLDLSLSGTILNTSGLTWDLGFVMSYNTSEVVDSKFDNVSRYLNGSVFSSPPVEGYGLQPVFAYRSAGLDENGSTLVYDKDGETVDAYTSLTDMEDLEYMGTSLPSYYGSINQTISYKRLSLYVLATYKLDYVLFKPTFDSYMNYGYFSGYNLNSNIDHRWRQPGDEATTDVPGIQGMNGYSFIRYAGSNKQVIDGDHIRLREVSLSYDLSGLFLKNWLTGASVNFTARNLGLIWTKNKEGLDPDFLPDTSSNIMTLRPPVTYTVGVNLNF